MADWLVAVKKRSDCIFAGIDHARIERASMPIVTAASGLLSLDCDPRQSLKFPRLSGFAFSSFIEMSAKSDGRRIGELNGFVFAIS